MCLGLMSLEGKGRSEVTDGSEARDWMLNTRMNGGNSPQIGGDSDRL
jgi:hypothetical protein